MTRTSFGAMRPGRRLMVECLEERAVPAFGLAIDGNTATANVSSAFVGGTTTFTATAIGATLDVADIATALGAGNVVITTGAAGSGDGSINWLWDNELDDLSYMAPAVRSLTLRPDASSTVGDVTIQKAFLTFANNVNLVVDTTAPAVDGFIRLLGDARVDRAASATFNAGTGAVNLGSASPSPMAESGNIVVTAGSFQNQIDGFALRSVQGNVTIDAPIDLSVAGLGIRADKGAVALNSPIDGAGDLSVYGKTVAINAAVGSGTPLNILTFAGGNATFTGTIDAATVEVGDNIVDPAQATLSSPGTITANLNVNFDGNLAPGGIGTTGQMSMVGDLTFKFGDYALDLGATPDKINVTGDVIINGGNLGDATSTGVLTGDIDFQVINLTGTVTGVFDNAPLNTGVIVGTDAIRVTHYGPAATGVTVARVAAAAKGTVSGAEIDGTGYTIKLTGAGELAAFTDAFGQLSIAARNTTLKSKIKITTKANASNAGITIGPVVINGDLGDFNAAGAVLNNAFTAAATVGTTGALKSLTFLQAFATIATPGEIGSLKTKANCFTAITASGIGKVQAGQLLIGLGDWNITNGIGSIAAAQIGGLNVTAKFIGSMSVKGDKKTNVSGDIILSTFRLTGNDGTPKAYGLKTLTTKGTVKSTTFDVEEGNVGSVSVGRFINSNLYLDFAPVGAFNVPGGFESAANFRVDKFATTAATIGDSTNPLNWSFAGSQIVADTIGKVTLTGLKTENAGVAFGIKFHTAGGTVQAKTSDSAAISPKANLSPDAAALDNQFYYLEI